MSGPLWRIEVGDARAVLAGLPAHSIHCVVTSPPYWSLRDYGLPPVHWDDGWEGSLGLEPTPELFVEHLVSVMREVRRVLRRDGTLWLNLGDSYQASRGKAGHVDPKSRARRFGTRPNDRPLPYLKHKNMVGIPWRVVFALQADGWWLRADCIWAKPNGIPGSQKDRPTSSHEHVFLLAPRTRYFYDEAAVREPATTPRKSGPNALRGQVEIRPRGNLQSLDAPTRGVERTLRDVWTVATQPYPGQHFATFPTRIPETCILAGTSAVGCCPACGVPWRRLVETDYRNPGNRTTNGPRSLANHGVTPGFGQRLEAERLTIGWAKPCSCPYQRPIPCVVLDPLSGAGTTLLVATRLGRRSIGIELKPEYAQQARDRITADQPSVVVPAPDQPRQMTIFEAIAQAEEAHAHKA